MSLYEEAPKPVKLNEEVVSGPKNELFNEITYQFDVADSVVYLVGEIDGFTLLDMMTRIRTILRNRAEEDEQPINMVINSDGGCVYEMLAIVDYMKSLPVPVNTICRGKAFSAAAVILASGTGTRYASKHSTIMFHQSSAWLQGKQADVRASIHHVSEIDIMSNILLSDKSTLSPEEWEQIQKTDYWLTAKGALDIKVIDQII
jgi:ATP-dependent Clp protease protease subunit